MDIQIENHGSIVLLRPRRVAGKRWLRDNIGHAERWGAAYVVEPRYVAPIVEGAQADGLEVA